DRAAAVVVEQVGPTRPLHRGGVDDALHGPIRLDPEVREVALDDQPVWPRALPGRAEARRVHDYAGPLLVLSQDLGDRAIGGREQELVDVEAGDPPSLVPVGADRVLIRVGLAR